MADMPDMIEGWPNFCGQEAQVDEAAHRPGPFYLTESRVDFAAIQAAWGIALHMQQPLVPAGGDDLRTAAIISYLQYMMEHQGLGDTHNAPVFHQCSKRIGDRVPALGDQGKEPR
ncbi:MAG: glycosyl hydrolase family 57, partial [Planctomycetes bacterium]|nr:glycosyl hydrolase family 57 [Planctomycetota bacterium]